MEEKLRYAISLDFCYGKDEAIKALKKLIGKIENHNDKMEYCETNYRQSPALIINALTDREWKEFEDS